MDAEVFISQMIRNHRAKSPKRGACNDNRDFDLAGRPARRSSEYVSDWRDPLIAEELCGLLVDFRMARRARVQSAPQEQFFSAADLQMMRLRQGPEISDEERRIKARIREIGTDLNERRRLAGMTYAHRWVMQLKSPSDASLLEKLWHGIGTWIA